MEIQEARFKRHMSVLIFLTVAYNAYALLVAL